MSNTTLKGVFTDIADAIRSKTDSSAIITPSEMAVKISEISTGTTFLAQITTVANATVHYIDTNETEYSVQADSTGYVEITLPRDGTWVFYASLDGVDGWKVTKTFAASDGLELTLYNVQITTTANATVHFVASDNTECSVQANSSGQAEIVLPGAGPWTVYASLDGVDGWKVTKTFAASDGLELYAYGNFGVKIAKSTSDPATALTYIDGASGMSTGWSAWKSKDIFKDVKPCVVKDGVVQYYLNPDNYTQKADGTTATINSTTAGDVMIEIPKMGYKMTSDSNYHYIWVTRQEDVDGYCYAAHSKNTEGDCDKIYIGAYLGYATSSKLYSISGVSPTVDTTLTSFRTYATNRGSNYELFSFYPMTLLQCLFLIMFKNRNSQSALGQGYTGASSKSNTGATNSNTFTYGSTSSTTHVKFLGIEDLWGNLWQWVDGIYGDSSYNILTYYKNMSGTNSGANYQYKLASGNSSSTYGYISDVVGTNHGGFVIKSNNGSSSTYYPDDGVLYAGSCASFGGGWSSGADAGVFRLDVDSAASDSYSNVGARLLLKHVSS